jgi:hypothetical protein
MRALHLSATNLLATTGRAGGSKIDVAEWTEEVKG